MLKGETLQDLQDLLDLLDSEGMWCRLAVIMKTMQKDTRLLKSDSDKQKKKKKMMMKMMEMKHSIC